MRIMFRLKSIAVMSLFIWIAAIFREYCLILWEMLLNITGGFVQTDITMDSTSLSIRVEDSGIGIAKEDQKRIFERFYRVDKGRSKRVAGTGLGLSIVKHVTEFYGGCVSVESQSGVGSTFLVQLPAASLVQK